MKTAKRLGSLLVLTEDSGRDGHETIVEVVKRMLRLLVPETHTHRIGFEPKNEEAQRAVNGTRWKSNSPRDKADFTIVLRTIATKLAREDGFVFFHVDADRTWSRRSECENKEKFQTLVIAKVRAILKERAPATQADAIEEKLRRLHIILPFYSIEAWLYQNTDVAIRIASQLHNKRHIDQFEAWKQDRTLLDDIPKPKEAVCLGSLHNLELARSAYPAQEVADAKRSYAACVESLSEIEPLLNLLRQTVMHDAEHSS